MGISKIIIFALISTLDGSLASTCGFSCSSQRSCPNSLRSSSVPRRWRLTMWTCASSNPESDEDRQQLHLGHRVLRITTCHHLQMISLSPHILMMTNASRNGSATLRTIPKILRMKLIFLTAMIRMKTAGLVTTNHPSWKKMRRTTAIRAQKIFHMNHWLVTNTRHQNNPWNKKRCVNLCIYFESSIDWNYISLVTYMISFAILIQYRSWFDNWIWCAGCTQLWVQWNKQTTSHMLHPSEP